MALSGMSSPRALLPCPEIVALSDTSADREASPAASHVGVRSAGAVSLVVLSDTDHDAVGSFHSEPVSLTATEVDTASECSVDADVVSSARSPTVLYPDFSDGTDSIDAGDQVSDSAMLPLAAASGESSYSYSASPEDDGLWECPHCHQRVVPAYQCSYCLSLNSDF